MNASIGGAWNRNGNVGLVGRIPMMIINVFRTRYIFMARVVLWNWRGSRGGGGFAAARDGGAGDGLEASALVARSDRGELGAEKNLAGGEPNPRSRGIRLAQRRSRWERSTTAVSDGGRSVSVAPQGVVDHCAVQQIATITSIRAQCCCALRAHHTIHASRVIMGIVLQTDLYRYWLPHLKTEDGGVFAIKSREIGNSNSEQRYVGGEWLGMVNPRRSK
jgi:hypothetical protein